MARARRLDGNGAWHHVMNRGSGRRVVFNDDRERQRFLDLVGVMGDRFDLETHAYCLMGNHFHLLVRSRSGMLSEGMQFLSSHYTRRVNHWRGVDGPLFRGRFVSVPVDEPDHLRVLCRYIHRNPIEAGLVELARDYRWSSLPSLLGDRPSERWLKTDTVLGWFGNRPDSLLAYVSDRREMDSGVEALLLDGSGDPEETSELGVAAVASPSAQLGRVLETVAQSFCCEPSIVHPGRKGSRNPARLALMLVLVDRLRLTPEEVANAMGVSPAAVRSGVHRARRRLARDDAFANDVGTVVSLLVGGSVRNAA